MGRRGRAALEFGTADDHRHKTSIRKNRTKVVTITICHDFVNWTPRCQGSVINFQRFGRLTFNDLGVIEACRGSLLQALETGLERNAGSAAQIEHRGHATKVRADPLSTG